MCYRSWRETLMFCFLFVEGRRRLHWFADIDGMKFHQPQEDIRLQFHVTQLLQKYQSGMSKNMKILAIVPDSITRAISDYAQLPGKRNHKQRFEDLAFVHTTIHIVDTTWIIIQIGIFAKFLERWLYNFPLEEIIFVWRKEFIADPAWDLSRVKDFLSIKEKVPCSKKTENGRLPDKNKKQVSSDSRSNRLGPLGDFYRPFKVKLPTNGTT